MYGKLDWKNGTIETVGRGNIKIKGNDINVTMQNVLYVPELRNYFLSAAELEKKGYSINF